MHGIDLLTKTEALVQDEKNCTIQIIHHLKVIDEQDLFFLRGNRSLYDYCTKTLKYTESEAMTRISAMRLLKQVPELEEKVKTSDLKLTQLAQLHAVVRAEKRSGNKLEKKQKIELAEKIAGKTSRETERTLLDLSPAWQAARQSQERMRMITSDITEVRLHGDKEFIDLLEEAKAIFACPQEMKPSTVRLLKEGLRLLIEEKKREKYAVLKSDKNIAPIAEIEFPTNRVIPRSLKRAVYARANHACEHIDAKSGHRCGEKYALEIHHLKTFSNGGSHSLMNLRVFCRIHNRAEAKAEFPAFFSTLENKRKN
jgi:5-methylcytosine-specific restriction endonuclease McrA